MTKPWSDLSSTERLQIIEQKLIEHDENVTKARAKEKNALADLVRLKAETIAEHYNKFTFTPKAKKVEVAS